MIPSTPSPVFQIPLKSSAAVPHRRNSRLLVISNSATAYKERSNISFSSPVNSTSLYDILGIPMGASSLEIKSAYRKLARTCHPDVASVDQKDASANEFMKIHEAYSTLLDPEKRAVYDSKLFSRDRPLKVALSGFGNRNWETDQCW